ncbi:MAG: DUF1573 domain-containing protein [Proteobacteria bacterium]|nr:DUF1573 domain-containing protein [Pseudomonadota bacterium]
MHKTIIAILCFLFVSLPLAARAEPRISIEKTRIEMKSPVLEGATVRGEFEVANTGDAELQITHVSPG